MAKTTKSKAAIQVSELRPKRGENQSEFWARFGVTQSGGSRYESGRNLPRPLQILIWLKQNNRISDDDLAAAVRATSKAEVK